MEVRRFSCHKSRGPVLGFFFFFGFNAWPCSQTLSTQKQGGNVASLCVLRPFQFKYSPRDWKDERSHEQMFVQKKTHIQEYKPSAFLSYKYRHMDTYASLCYLWPSQCFYQEFSKAASPFSGISVMTFPSAKSPYPKRNIILKILAIW